MLITEGGVVLSVIAPDGVEHLVHLDATLTEGGQVRVMAGALMDFASAFSPEAAVFMGQITPTVTEPTPEEKTTHEVRSFFNDELVLDPNKRQALIRGTPTKFTNQEWSLLWFLSGKKNTFLTREQILSGAWPKGYVYEGFEGGGRTVDVHVRRVRRGLGSLCMPDDAKEGIIRTSKGYGYGFFAQDTEIES